MALDTKNGVIPTTYTTVSFEMITNVSEVNIEYWISPTKPTDEKKGHTLKPNDTIVIDMFEDGAIFHFISRVMPVSVTITEKV